MTFDELILHPRTRQLTKNLAKKLPHGIIIEGPAGTGVATVAKTFAKHVSSPEFVILPKKKLKGEFIVDPDNGSIVIDDIRLLYQQTRSKQSGSHVYIIDTGMKSMTIAAQNAFLKLLEEPHEGLHFIIATHQFDQLLPTIVSRCQHLSLLPVTDEQTNELISELAINDATKRTRLAFVGRGRPALIKRLVSDDESYESRVKIMSDAKTLLGADTYEKVRVINSYRENRADATTLLDDMNYQLQIIIKSQPNREIAATIDRNLETRMRIAAGGNIRIQLLSNILA